MILAKPVPPFRVLPEETQSHYPAPLTWPGCRRARRVEQAVGTDAFQGLA